MNPKLDKLDSMLITNDNLNYHQEIESFLETEEILDIWRVMNPDTRFYTWRLGNNQQSKLDYLFTSEHLINVLSEVDIIPGIHSDHSLLKLAFSNNTKNNIGKDLWKFNSGLLHDHTYVQNIKNIISESSVKYKYLKDKAMVWELVKLDIQTFTRP